MSGKAYNLSSLEVKLTPERKEVLGNHLFYAFAYVKDANLSSAEIATYLSIIKEIFEYDVEEGYKSMDASFDNFKKLLLLHSVDRSPVSIKVFERQAIPGLIDNMTDTYYRHYRMYQYIFAKQETLTLMQRRLFDLETVSYIAPLCEGVLLRDENDFGDDMIHEFEEQKGEGEEADNVSDEEEEETADVDEADRAKIAVQDPDIDGQKARLKAAKRVVQSLKSKIAEIRHYRVAPGKEAIRVLKGTLYFLKYNRTQFHDGRKVDWKRMRMLLDEQFFNKLQNVDVTAVVKRPKYANLKRISALIEGIQPVDVAEKSVPVAAILDWLIAAIVLKKSTLPVKAEVEEDANAK